MRLTESQRKVFATLADAILPPLTSADPFDAASGSALAMGRLPELLDRLDPVDRRNASLLLHALTTRAGALLLLGRATPLTQMSSLEAEGAILAMLASPRSVHRTTARLVTQLVLTLATWPSVDRKPTVLHTAMGYPGPRTPAPDVPRRLRTETVAEPSTWSCDVVIVGSGAGGGTAAGVLAAAGLDVVVLERGGYFAERDFTHHQDDADRDLLDTRTSADLGIGLLSGKALGGGTLINYTTSLRTPGDVRAGWDHEAGLRDVFEGARFTEALDAVSQRIGVTDRESRPWARDRVIEAGCVKLGLSVLPMPRNVRGCSQDEQCGFCNFGCRSGAKQSTLRTWLEDAADHGARIVPRADVERVVIDGGRAVGVRAKVKSASGEPVTLTVFAKAVVVAAGALFTPTLLHRSGVRAPALGRHLRLHPVTGLFGLMDEPTDPWGGVMQARIGTGLSNLDGTGHGIRYEAGALHPVEYALFGGFGGGAELKRFLRSYRHQSALGVVLRDHGEGHVELTRRGPSRYHYRLTAADMGHVRTGVHRGVELLLAAGAREVRACQLTPQVHRPASGERLASFLSRLDAQGYQVLRSSYGSFHQMGTARMGKDPRTSVTSEHNEVHGVPDLYVLDGSSFPSASGVNPMLTIEAVAYRGARLLAQRLGR